MSMYRRRLMITNALKRSDGNINYPGIIAAWSAKGKTNDDEDKATLKDLTGNGHDITLNNFSFSEMSGYGGYKTNMLNWKYNKNSAVILSSQNKFITYNTLEIATHFWDYVSTPPLGTIHRPSFKLKISGLNEDEVIYYTYADGEDFSVPHEGNLYNGINIFPEINAEIVTEKLPYTTVFEIQSQRILDKEITFEILPEYPDALVFDGIDDYGVNEDMPILTDYTIIYHLQRDILNSSNGAVISKGYTDGEFSAEEWRTNFINFGYKNRINVPLYDICYGTLKLYNGQLLGKGGTAGSNEITIGRTSSNTSYYRSIAFYSAYLFDRSLDEQEIKAFIRKYIDPEYLLPSEIPTTDCYYDFSQGSNDDENRDIIKDYSGNGNDAVAHNFAWSGMSGYGGYNLDMTLMWGNNLTPDVKTQYKTYVTIKSDDFPYSKIYIGRIQQNTKVIELGKNIRFKISGLKNNQGIRWNYNSLSDYGYTNELHYHYSNDILEIYMPKEIANSNDTFINIDFISDKNDVVDVRIELLPEYPGALVFDGVDDYISLDAFDSGFKTMFMVCNPRNKSNAFLYDQRKNTERPYDYGLYTYNSWFI